MSNGSYPATQHAAITVVTTPFILIDTMKNRDLQARYKSGYTIAWHEDRVRLPFNRGVDFQLLFAHLEILVRYALSSK